MSEIKAPSNKFKIGDKVYEYSTGDVGTITEYDQDLSNRHAWFILWETGELKGYTLWSFESDIGLLDSQKTSCDTIDLSEQEITISGITYILKRK